MYNNCAWIFYYIIMIIETLSNTFRKYSKIYVNLCHDQVFKIKIILFRY